MTEYVLLKPCSFCKTEHEKHSEHGLRIIWRHVTFDDKKYYQVECNCGKRGPLSLTIDGAANKWNEENWGGTKYMVENIKD